jgi:opacity protein-like surface antigen
MLPAVAMADAYVSAGINPSRSQAYSIGAGWLPFGNGDNRLGLELEYASYGEQPPGYPNLNRTVNISIVGFARFSERIGGFGRAGTNNSHFSYNGTNDYDRSGDNLWGHHMGAGLEYVLTENLRLQAQITAFTYVQVNNPNDGIYHHATVGLRYVFK